MPNSKTLLTAGGFLSFFVFGFVDNLKGPLLPELLRDGAFSYSQAGTIVFTGYVGFIAATLAMGILADVISNRSVLFLAALSLSLGGIGLATTSSYFGLMLFMGVIGIGLGAIELGGNGLMVELHSSARGRYLNLLSTCHGCGSLLVPLYAAWLINAGIKWPLIYGSTVMLSLMLAIVFWPRLMSKGAAERSAESGHSVGRGGVRSGWDWQSLRRSGFTQNMCWFYVLLAAYVAVELGVAAWMIEFLQQLRGMSVGTSSIYLSMFFVMLMLGRLLGAFVVEHIGYFRAIVIALVGSALCLSGGIFGDRSYVFLLPLSGLFLSIVFPTVTAAVSELHRANMGSILGLLFAFAGVGGALGPWTVGFVSDRVGLQFGLASVLGFELLALAAVFCLWRLKR